MTINPFVFIGVYVLIGASCGALGHIVGIVRGIEQERRRLRPANEKSAPTLQ